MSKNTLEREAVLERLAEASQRATSKLEDTQWLPSRAHFEGLRNTINEAISALKPPPVSSVEGDEVRDRVLRDESGGKYGTTPESEPVVVQADRDAAADLYREWRKPVSERCAREGRNDGDDLVRALARHRIEASREAQAVLPGEIGELIERLRRAVPVLRSWGMSSTAPLVKEAADTISNLQATVLRLERMLGPFASADFSGSIWMPDDIAVPGTSITVADFRAARTVLKPTSKYGHGSTGNEMGDG